MPDAYKAPARPTAGRQTKQALPCGKPGAGKTSWYWLLKTILKKREVHEVNHD